MLCVPVGYNIWKNGLDPKMDATHLLHDILVDSFINEAFSQHQIIMMWEKNGGLCFTNYGMYVASNCKTTFFAKRDIVHINTW